MVLQIVEVTDYYKFPNVVAFDQYGKNACLEYFNRLFQHLKEEGLIYHGELNLTTGNTYTYMENFFKIEDNLLVKANGFADCNFYERSFYTADAKGRDIGIVSSIDYTILNSGLMMKRPA